MRQITPQMLATVLDVFNVQLPHPLTLETFNLAKAEAKKQYKRMAMEHHPDRGGDAEVFKKISAAWGALEQIKVQRAPPIPTVTYVSVTYTPSTTTTDTVTQGVHTW